MSKIYVKLVRDKIPEIIKESGSSCDTKTLSESEYKRFLDDKLDEEVEEYKRDKNIEELADILEVVYAIAELNGCSAEELDNIRNKKAEERGRFKERILLISVSKK